MKKFLLSIAILGTSFCANAEDNLREFSDCFTVTYNGQELKDGDEVVCTNYQDLSDIVAPNTIKYDCDIEIENQDLMPAYIRGVLGYNKPTYREWNAATYVWEGEVLHEWGEPQLCFSTFSDGITVPGGCLPSVDKINCGQGNGRVPASGVGKFIWNLHLDRALKDRESRYSLSLTAVTGEDAAATPVSKSIKIFINYRMTPDSGVDEIEAAEGEGVWYDLQGRRVDNPSKGLYIYKTAGKAVKRIVK